MSQNNVTKLDYVFAGLILIAILGLGVLAQLYLPNSDYNIRRRLELLEQRANDSRPG